MSASQLDLSGCNYSRAPMTMCHGRPAGSACTAVCLSSSHLESCGKRGEHVQINWHPSTSFCLFCLHFCGLALVTTDNVSFQVLIGSRTVTPVFICLALKTGVFVCLHANQYCALDHNGHSTIWKMKGWSTYRQHCVHINY